MFSSPSPQGPDNLGADFFSGQPQQQPLTPPTQQEQSEQDIQHQQGFPLIVPDIGEQQEIVGQCVKMKYNFILNDREKKYTQKKCYAYSKSKFIDKWDLLPRPGAEGQDRDNDQSRPEIFMPLSRQQLKILHSFLMLTLFPDDEDYVRIRSKTRQGAALEDTLTEGFKYALKEMQFTRQIDEWIWDIGTFGIGVAHPIIKTNYQWEWMIDAQRQEFRPKLNAKPYLSLETWNPIHFYIDGIAKRPEECKWYYWSVMKKESVQLQEYYINKDKLNDFGMQSLLLYDVYEGLDISEINQKNPLYLDNEDNLYVSHFYFPYLKTSKREYFNMLVSIANDQTLIEFRPNMTPKGDPPVIFTAWQKDKDSQYGTGPMEDIIEIQRLINIVYNYLIEQMARCGNRFFVDGDVDFESAWGIAGGIIQGDGGQITPIIGDMAEFQFIMNFLGTIKAEGQLITGAQDPFQGSSNIDFQKTATEIQVIQENSISQMRDVLENISLGVQRILERFMILLPDLYTEPMEVPIDDPLTGQTQYQMIDFRVLKSGDFVIELMGANPSQSKNAQIQGLMQLIQGLMHNPQSVMILEPLITRIGLLSGEKDISELLNQVKENLMRMQQHVAQQAPQQPGQPPGQQSAPGTPQSPQSIQ